MPEHKELDPAVPTIGSILRDAGYRSSYIGKWHLSQSATPDMTAYGFADWEGNDRHFMGWAGTGVHFDPIIAANAASWLRANAANAAEPWFLTVALVNPHDVMWFPIDQPGYDERHPDEVRRARKVLEWAKWKEDDVLPSSTPATTRCATRLPPNFGDDLLDKPAAQRQWRWDQQHGLWGYIDPSDTEVVAAPPRLLREAAADGRRVARHGARARSRSRGAYDDTIIIFTSDHGDMCGSHGLRSKGPFVYEEIMHVPCYMRVPGVTRPGSQSDALATHVDLASTICALGGVDPASQPSLKGVDLSAGARRSRRRPCAITCCSRTTPRTPTRSITPATRSAASSTGRPSTRATTAWAAASPAPGSGARTRDTSCSTSTPTSSTRNTSGTTCTMIPHELVNLAHDGGRRADLHANYERLARVRAPSSPSFSS